MQNEEMDNFAGTIFAVSSMLENQSEAATSDASCGGCGGCSCETEEEEEQEEEELG